MFDDSKCANLSVRARIGGTVAELNVFKRTDDKYAWRLKADNGQVIATDGSQGYSKRADAVEMGTKVITGTYKDAKVTDG
jgi:uncharacterized protein YegP (UPF0339 family)